MSTLAAIPAFICLAFSPPDPKLGEEVCYNTFEYNNLFDSGTDNLTVEVRNGSMVMCQNIQDVLFDCRYYPYSIRGYAVGAEDRVNYQVDTDVIFRDDMQEGYTLFE